MKLETLCEKRRNADHPSQERRHGSQVLQHYRKMSPVERDNFFVSFTSVDKLGINPMSSYGTPIGIYTYPLDYVMNQERPEEVPFAGKNPNMWVVKATKPVLNLGKYDNLDRDQHKAKKYLMSHLNMSESDAVELINDAISTAKYNINMDAPRMWNIARRIAKVMTKDSHRVDPSSNEKVSNDTIHFNTVLRKVFGYHVINDPNLGVIHVNEPTQCVFLSKDALEVVEKLNYNHNSYEPFPDGHHVMRAKKEGHQEVLNTNLKRLGELEGKAKKIIDLINSVNGHELIRKSGEMLDDLTKIRKSLAWIEGKLIPGYTWVEGTEWRVKITKKFSERHNCEQRLKELNALCDMIYNKLTTLSN